MIDSHYRRSFLPECSHVRLLQLPVILAAPLKLCQDPSRAQLFPCDSPASRKCPQVQSSVCTSSPQAGTNLVPNQRQGGSTAAALPSPSSQSRPALTPSAAGACHLLDTDNPNSLVTTSGLERNRRQRPRNFSYLQIRLQLIGLQRSRAQV